MSADLRIADIIVGERDRQELGDIAVYAVADRQGETLYIGQTNDLRRRLGEHKRRAPWWKRAVRVDVVGAYADRAEALDCERYVIEACHPKYNVVHGTRGAAALNLALERLCGEHGVETLEEMADITVAAGLTANELVRRPA